MEAQRDRERMTAQEAILSLLEERGNGKTICPSEAARLLAGPNGDWRALMDHVHQAADALKTSDQISLSFRGKVLDQRRGAYRIARR